MTRTQALFAVFLVPMVIWCSVILASEHDEPREGGLTGTGIVGIVTQLGSILVNDQRIIFADDMVVSSPLGTFPATDLRPGDSVAAMVVPSDADWVAQELIRTYPIVGPILSRTDSDITVMGTRIDYSALAVAPDYQVGDWIAVSGLWRGEVVLASKLEKIPPQKYAQLFGSYVQPALNQETKIGNTIIGSIVLEHAKPGDPIRVFGIPTPHSLEAREVDLGLFRQPVGILLVEGFVTPTGPGGHYSVPGSGIKVFVPDTPVEMETEASRLCGFSGNPPSDTLPDATQEILDRLGC